MEITQEYLDKMFGKLATSEELGQITSRLGSMQETLDSHSMAFDVLLKQTKDWNVEMTVMRGRMEKYESALKILAGKMNVDLKSLLN